MASCISVFKGTVMIKGITSNSKYLIVSGGQSSGTYINNYSSGQGVGNMRYNTSSQNMEVFDGNNWVTLVSSFASVDLNAEAQLALDWVQQQRDKEFKREALIKENPALQKAYEAIKRAEANFDILEKFVENDSNTAEYRLV